MKRQLLLSIFVITALVFGCAKKQQVPVSQDQQTPPAQEELTKKIPETKVDTDKRDKIPQETITERQHQPVQREDIKATIRELQKNIKDVFFGFDRYDLDEPSRATIKQVADVLSKNSKIRVIIEGHCDERGTREYNLGLGERRANSVKEYLVSLGVPSIRVDTISYGKEKPQCTDKTEECWAKNRRAHFVFVEEVQ